MLMKNREEDIEVNLTGEETIGNDASKSRWFKRIRKGITTSTADKKETPEGLWTKCPSCNHICTSSELKENLFICTKCNFHHRILVTVKSVSQNKILFAFLAALFSSSN